MFISNVAKACKVSTAIVSKVLFDNLACYFALS